MIAVKLVTHSLSMVWRNRRDALRVAGPLIVVTLASQLFMYFALGVNPFAGETVHVAADGWLGGLMIVLSVLGGVAGLWTYVAWHRFVLLADYPRGYWLPVPAGRVLAYLGYSILFGVITALFAAVIGAGFGLVGGAMDNLLNGGPSVMTAAALAFAALLVIALSLRLSVMLPAAAIGQSLGPKAAWQATKGAGITLLLAAILLALVFAIFGVPMGMLGALVPAPINFLLILPFTMFLTLVGVSFLTTIYGYYVEDRALG